MIARRLFIDELDRAVITSPKEVFVGLKGEHLAFVWAGNYDEAGHVEDPRNTGSRPVG
jgi:hypothetical protein